MYPSLITILYFPIKDKMNERTLIKGLKSEIQKAKTMF